MKTNNLLQTGRIGWHWAALLGLWVAVFALSAAETNPPLATVTNAPVVTATNARPAVVTNAPQQRVEAPPMTPEQMFEGGTNAFNNWIDLSAGGFISSGSKAQLQQWHQTPHGAFGGVEDFYYQADLAKGTTLTTDGRAIFDTDDYKLSLGVPREKRGFPIRNTAPGTMAMAASSPRRGRIFPCRAAHRHSTTAISPSRRG
jgi:hypothetical protein